MFARAFNDIGFPVFSLFQRRKNKKEPDKTRKALSTFSFIFVSLIICLRLRI